MSVETASSKRKTSVKDARPAKKAKSSEKPKEKQVNEKLKATADANKSRKRAVEFIPEDEKAQPAESSPKPKKVKVSKKVEIVEPVPTSISKTKSKDKSGLKKESKKWKESDSKAVVVAEQEEEIALPASDDEEDVAALLAGFSSDEEEESDKEEGLDLEKVPKLDKKAKKALEKAKKKGGDEDTPGTIYVGRIPHGFYEHQMRAYFAQFGSILHLRLSRNKKTGASKHYAFIQFASTTVADIVARTMNNYLMFGHILKVRLIPEEQVHPEMWKGANKRFKVVPRSMLERKEMERAKGREYWEGKVEKESKKRERKRKTMEALGYEYKAPELKKVDDMPMQDVEVEEELVKAKEDGAAEQEEEKEEEKMKAIVEVPAEVDEVQVEVEKIVKKGKKEKKETVKVKATKKVKV